MTSWLVFTARLILPPDMVVYSTGQYKSQSKTYQEMSDPQLSGKSRLHHLDFLRAAMMFLGVLVHSSHADFDHGNYEIIRAVSGSFRMACFFIIAGFFSVLVLNRSSVQTFFGTRLLMLATPALVCVIFLVPTTVEWMQLYFREGGTSNQPHSGWMGHAWFLFVLIAYTLVLCQLRDLVSHSVDWMGRVMGLWVAQAIFICLVILVSMFAAKVIQKYGSTLPYQEHWRFLLSAIVGYLPYFIFGLMMYKWSNIYALVHRLPIVWILSAVLLLAAKLFLSQYKITSTTQHLLYMILSHAAAFSISAALFSVCVRLINSHNRVIRTLSESAYTVYILHYVIISIVLVELQRLGAPMLFSMLISFMIASVLGVAIHVYIVRSYWLAALLLNGRLRVKNAQ